MNQEERLERLIGLLAAARPEAGGLEATGSPEQKKRMFRSLMNLWQPGPLPGEYWALQDAYLQEELSKKEITDGMALPPSPLHPKLALWQGDITTLRADAIVNAANAALLGCFLPCHGCIDNAIHSAAGLQLRLACQALMERQGRGEPAGGAKLTEGFNLPSRYVLHTVGPIISGRLCEEDCRLLGSCYRSCLELADKQGLASLAFCCISTGEFRFPNERAAQIAVNTVVEYLESHPQSSLKKVIFNVFKEQDGLIYRSLLG